MEPIEKMTTEQKAALIRELANDLVQQDELNVLLKAIGVPLLEQLRTEAARGSLSKLVITEDGKFLLRKEGREDREVMLTPVHKAVYMLFLNHPEGIEFKLLSDYREELEGYYRLFANRTDEEKIKETVDRLISPLDNAISEKCSRIKAEFSSMMDEYSARYYIISSHTVKHIENSQRVWFERKKVVLLPRELVVRL